MQKAVGFFLRLFPPDTKPLKPVSGAPRLSQRRPKGAPRPRGDGKGVGGGRAKLLTSLRLLIGKFNSLRVAAPDRRRVF